MDEYHYIEIHNFETNNEAIKWAKKHIKPDESKPMLVVTNKFTIIENNTPKDIEEVYIEIAFEQYTSFESVDDALEWIKTHLTSDETKIIKILQSETFTLTLKQGMQEKEKP